jgi:hypothetical protein
VESARARAKGKKLSLFLSLRTCEHHIHFSFFFPSAMAAPSPPNERSEAAALARLLQVTLSPPSNPELLYLPEFSKVRERHFFREREKGEGERED